jgi:hypothetical protein
MKSPNQALAQQTYNYPPEQLTQGPKPEAYSVGGKPAQIAWPGMEVIRKFSGEAISSASGSGEAAPEDAPEEAPAE